MGAFSDKVSTSLSSGFVYYQDLKKTRPNLYKSVSSSIKTRLTSKDSIKYQQARIISNIESLLSSERRKELDCLRTGFGVTINVDESMLLSPNIDKDITSAFNELLQTKEMFQRHKDRINHINKQGKLSHQAKIGFANVFEQQLLQVLNARIKEWVHEIRDLMVSNINATLDSIVRTVITEKRIDDAIIEALEVARVSGDWSKTDREKGLQGYLEILTEILAQIRSMPNHPLMEAIKQQYGFDKLANNIVKEINNEKKNKNKKGKKNSKSWAKKGLTYSGFSKGTIAEEFAVQTIKALNNLKGGSDSIKWDITVARTGDIGKMKADMMIGVNLPVDDIINMFNPISMREIEEGSSVREHNYEEFARINHKLSAWDADQFLIYTNIKEYSLVQYTMPSGYIFSGFSTGSPLKASVLQGLGIPMEIIGAIINTLNGAIGEGLQDYLNDVLAEYFARFLFDDFDVIGYSQRGVQSIHMMLLNGIYVPLSVCYSALLQSFKAATVTEVFKATISEGEILFHSEPIEGWNYQQWLEQKETAMNTVTVTVNIMANFISFMQQFGTR